MPIPESEYIRYALSCVVTINETFSQSLIGLSRQKSVISPQASQLDLDFDVLNRGSDR